ncbi:hypothetical protein OIU78_027144, partial [Salix suchowensis]
MVQQWITKNNVDFAGFLEPRIIPSKVKVVEAGLALPNWRYVSNISHHPTCRILVGWNSRKVKITNVQLANQWVTCDAEVKGGSGLMRVTFVYGQNTPAERHDLWNYLINQSLSNGSIPWVVMGDCNAILSGEDRHGGDPRWHNYMDDFPKCINQAELSPISATGLRFSWTNSQQNEAAIFRKLDWALGNHNFLAKWPSSQAKFLPRLISDHSPIVLTLAPKSPQQRRRFKFLNLWTKNQNYESILQSVWATHSFGSPTNRLMNKLRLLKGHLRNLHQHHSSHISFRVQKAQKDWEAIQQKLDSNPQAHQLMQEEKEACHRFNSLKADEESFYKQKSRIQWLNLGDRNTAFFHRSLIHRQHRNGIQSLRTSTGDEITDQEQMGSLAVDFFQHLLTPASTTNLTAMVHWYPNSISMAEGEKMQ